MKSLRIINRRAGAVFVTAALVFATMIPALASAATLTQRSIALSSSVKATANVTYDVDFTAETDDTGALVVDFCDSAAIGTTCNTPSGFNIDTIGTSSAHTVTEVDANTAKVVLSAPVDTDDPVAFDITGITNPTNAGVIYARIVTYTDGDSSAMPTGHYGYVSATDLDGSANDQDPLDTGGVAMSITDGFGVSGAVLETMIFCASGTDVITSGCGGSLTSPNVSLGAGGVLTTALATGTIYTQISTNAAGGAVVSLKSNATGCGGLVRAGASSNALGCGITPLTAAGSISTGAAKFGLMLAGLSGTAVSGSYSTTDYFMDYVNGDASGVTGPYGSAIFNTSGAPVNDGTADLTFGANISNVTPAGNYSAALNLIATGTF